MRDIRFVNGLIYKGKPVKSPDFVICDLSMNKKSLIDWLKEQPEEWINVQVKESKQGKYYCAVNDWKKGKPQEDENVLF